jgi:hypothetical protein
MDIIIAQYQKGWGWLPSHIGGFFYVQNYENVFVNFLDFCQ